MLESLEGGERWARYTFLATEPREVFRYRGREVARWRPGEAWAVVERDVAPLEHLGRTMRRYPPVEVPGLPRFTGARSVTSATTWSAPSSTCPTRRPMTASSPTPS